jgi:hypothetical protein
LVYINISIYDRKKIFPQKNKLTVKDIISHGNQVGHIFMLMNANNMNPLQLANKKMKRTSSLHTNRSEHHIMELKMYRKVSERTLIQFLSASTPSTHELLKRTV